MEVGDNEMVIGNETPTTRVLYVNGNVLLKYMERQLGKGGHFTNVLRRRFCILHLLGWGGGYDTPNVATNDIITAIHNKVPILQAEMNFDIRRVQCKLWLSGLKVFRQVVWGATNVMHLEHMEQCQLAQLYRGQYSITKPMIMWHMDYEIIPNPCLCGLQFAIYGRWD